MKAFSEVALTKKHFHRYRRLTPLIYARVKTLAVKLRGLSILHINATPKGGGVAELLRSQVALERSLGLDSSWFVIPPEPNFFQITKKNA